MNKLITLLFLILSLGCSNQQTGEEDRIIKHLESQLDYAVKNAELLATSELISPRTSENGKLKLVKTRDWTSGFFSGNLWMMYELTGDEKWKETALKFTLPLEQEKWNGNTHDMGFKMYCSFGQAIKYTDNPEYREILIQSAKTLSTRFNPVVGCIRSWDHNSDKWDYPVIIDNMMNLELLLWAAKETGNENFKEIAIKHAETTIKNHFRDNYSSYHVIDYNPQTGEVQHKNTHQGYADESAWSRGQAWGLYGFTMLYRETGNDEFLGQAERIADFILSQPGIKQGEIPYWDFDAPGIPEEPLDASAGAIIASALFELSTFSDKQREYVSVARNLLATLSTDKFLAPVGENEGFLLKHSTGHKPHDSEIDEPLVYADYYFLEAIIRNRALKTKDE
ncbi:glycoside hydrolase family 88 protein [Draconibacterium sediminis]|uniref:glycoside hydrolase family 88 protein n=1 Tax=Draconibacterium sediminis TaxID=1544798 RepID=UPI0026F1A390|nr:glycoside hydrolase family 88 protein [Draconibacterium sediminis]